MTRSIALLLLLVAACGADETADADDTMTPPEPPAEDPGEPEVVPPTLELDAVPETTSWMSVTVTGVGPAQGSIVVQAPATGELAFDIGLDGHFCAEVDLEAGTSNSISFQAFDTAAVASEPVAVEVVQEGTPEDGNVAEGGVVDDMTVAIDDGEAAFLTDGNPTTTVRLSNSLLHDDWLSLRLAERAHIEHIRVLSEIDCPMKEYLVMISDLEDPGPAVEGDTDWRVVEHVRDGGFERTIDVYPTDARFVGIQFLSKDCAGVLETGKHEIREIQALTAAADAPACPVD